MGLEDLLVYFNGCAGVYYVGSDARTIIVRVDIVPLPKSHCFTYNQSPVGIQKICS